MYSDVESTASSRSSTSGELRYTVREGKGTDRGVVRANGDSYELDEKASAVICDESDGDDGDYGKTVADKCDFDDDVVKESQVSVSCLERCAILFDAAFFDPRSYCGGNAHIVECSLKVVEYPFCEPKEMPTETLLHTPVISASNMKKFRRATTAEWWGQLITTQHGIPCTAKGTGTGFLELQRYVRTYRAYIEAYCHTLRNSDNNNISSTVGDVHMSVALNEKCFHGKMPGVLLDAVNAALEACGAEDTQGEVAFLTTQERYDEVCKCLLQLQRCLKISLPRYKVFTIASTLGDDWEALVLSERETCNCGYHKFLMKNSYGNSRHCCEATVTAMMKVLTAATSKLQGL